MTAKIEDRDMGYAQFKENFEDWEGGVFVDIGALRENFSEEDVYQKGHQNEFGAVVDGVRIPARPHHRPAFDEKQREYLRHLEAALDDPVDMDFKRALEDIGREHTAHLQKVIEDYSTPPNAPSTIRKKGFDDPLVETGEYGEDMDWRVHDDRKL